MPNGIYNMYLVHFDSGLLGSPKKVTFKGFQNGRPVLTTMGGTVILADSFYDEVSDDEDDLVSSPREWPVRTVTGSCRTVKFSHAHVNLHDYLAKTQHLVKGSMYRMYKLKYDPEWDDIYQLVTFKGWTPFVDGRNMRDGFANELETCSPLFRCHIMKERFLLHFDERTQQWCTAAGEKVFFLAAMPMHRQDDHYLKIQTMVTLAEGPDDEVRICTPVTLSKIRYGKHLLTADGNRTDPVTLTRPELTKAVYLETDCLEGGRVACLYHHSTLNDLMQRNLFISPITRKPFSRVNILRVRYTICEESPSEVRRVA